MLRLIEKVRDYLGAFDNNPDEVDLLMSQLQFIANNPEAKIDKKKIIGVLNIMMEDLHLYSTAMLSMLNILYPMDYSALPHKKINQIIDGYKKISQASLTELNKNKSNFLDYVLVSAGDLRALLLSMAVNIYELRNLNDYVNRKQLIIDFTQEVYIPLCHRLGFYRIKSEMEDIVFQHIKPEIYSQIQQKIYDSSRERDGFIRNFILPIEEELKAQNMVFKIKWRTKSIASIHSKMVAQEIPFEKVFDLFAVRIITESAINKEKSDCWQVFSVVTNIYKSDTKRLRDWISKPRENGYESLHITVETPQKKFVEVQIRTSRMDDEAENGMSAHWRYKGGKSDENVNNFLLKIRKAIENKEVAKDSYDEMSPAKELFVFTPAGELRKLPLGATVLDFAFSIHSEVGVRCNGARVNGVLKPIKHPLSNGDRVEIMTSRSQKPTLDWLNFVSSNKAKNRIRKAVDEAKRIEAENGKEILQRRLKNWKLEFNQELVDDLVNAYKPKHIMDIYCEIARGTLDLLNVKKLLSGKYESIAKDETHEILEKSNLKNRSNDDLLIDEMDQLNYKLAACCHPVPGDQIFGFVTISKGITIHRMDCSNAKSMFDRYSYRIIPARWKGKDDTSKFRTEIFIKGLDRDEVLSDITKTVNSFATLVQVNISSIGKNFQGKITVSIYDANQINSLISSLKKLRDVVEVYRIGS